MSEGTRWFFSPNEFRVHRRHASEHAIRFMCRVIGVTGSCCYAWQYATPGRAARAAWRYRLGAEIATIFLESKKRYGAPRIHHSDAASSMRARRIRKS